MEEYTQITFDMWLSWKEDVRRKLNETAQNFVHIGYRLKQIRDSGMFDGEEDIFGFAQKEYGLSKSTVSRFIAINEKYSEGGNSLELKEEFRGFSSSKLSEMLTLPDEQIELITEQTTVQSIRDLKAFNREAEQMKKEEGENALPHGENSAFEAVATSQQNEPVSTSKQEAPDEAAGEAKNQNYEEMPLADEVYRVFTPFENCVIDLFKGDLPKAGDVLFKIKNGSYKDVAEMLAPSGNAPHKKGICFLFMYDYEKGVKYQLMTEREPHTLSWEDFCKVIEDICDSGNMKEIFEDGKNAVPHGEKSAFEAPVKPQNEPSEEQEEQKEPISDAEITDQKEPQSLDFPRSGADFEENSENEGQNALEHGEKSAFEAVATSQQNKEPDEEHDEEPDEAAGQEESQEAAGQEVEDTIESYIEEMIAITANVSTILRLHPESASEFQRLRDQTVRLYDISVEALQKVQEQ